MMRSLTKWLMLTRAGGLLMTFLVGYSLVAALVGPSLLWWLAVAAQMAVFGQRSKFMRNQFCPQCGVHIKDCWLMECRKLGR